MTFATAAAIRTASSRAGKQDDVDHLRYPQLRHDEKARAWLDAAGVDHAFHDYKTAGVPAADLRRWVDRLGWETLLNRAGTTFRKLPEVDRADLDAERAIALMLAHPSTIKRPVLERGDLLLVGFKPDAYAAALTN